MKDATQKLGMTVHTIRHYCDMGLVPNLTKDAYGNRLFDDASLNWLETVGYCRACGMSLAEIKAFFDLRLQGDSTLAARREILTEVNKKNEAELVQLQERIAYINIRIEELKVMERENLVDEFNPINW